MQFSIERREYDERSRPGKHTHGGRSPGKLMSYEAILKELGENLIPARSAREALDQLLRHDIAVVLMDVSMPEIDGFELADMMRQHPQVPENRYYLHLCRSPDRSRSHQGIQERRGRLHLRSCRS